MSGDYTGIAVGLQAVPVDRAVHRQIQNGYLTNDVTEIFANLEIRAHKSRENPMAVRTYPHSTRFSQNEWGAVTNAEERLDMMPGAFVREATARAAAEKGGLAEARLTSELINLLKKTFRGVQLLANLKREELEQPLTGSRTSRARRRMPGPSRMRPWDWTTSRRSDECPIPMRGDPRQIRVSGSEGGWMSGDRIGRSVLANWACQAQFPMFCADLE